jgi:outer membrane lipoprotein SlyB
VILQAGTLTASGVGMKKTFLFFAALAVLAIAGCGQNNNSADENSGTNSAAQDVEQGASNAWQGTKDVATNAWNATKDGATNAWNKTTNAVGN